MQLALDVVEDLDVGFDRGAIEIAQPLQRGVDSGDAGRLPDGVTRRSGLRSPDRFDSCVVHAMTVADGPPRGLRPRLD